MSEPTPHASEAAAARPEVLDPATLEQLLALDDGALGLLGEMAQIFQDDTPPRLAALERGLARQRRDEVGDTAHAIKGAASTMGASRLRVTAQALESLARLGEGPLEGQELLERLKAEFQEACAALQAFLAAREAQG